MRAGWLTCWIGGLGVFVTTATSAPDARACTPPPTGVEGRTVLPEDGATDVPLNARVYVLYDTQGSDPGSTLELRVQDGATVAVDETTPYTIGAARLLAPTAPLAPSTTYEILDTLALPCDSELPRTCIAEPTVIATFTTGAALDTARPSVTGVSVTSRGACVADSCPDSESEQLDHISIDQVIDDFPTSWVMYEYLDLDGALVAGPTAWLTTGRGCGDGAGYFPTYRYLAVPSDVLLRAVDLAGNVEASPHPIDGGTCALLECDTSGDTATAGADGGGCALHRGTNPGVLALALGALLLARRRPRVRSRACAHTATPSP